MKIKPFNQSELKKYFGVKNPEKNSHCKFKFTIFDYLGNIFQNIKCNNEDETYRLLYDLDVKYNGKVIANSYINGKLLGKDYRL